MLVLQPAYNAQPLPQRDGSRPVSSRFSIPRSTGRIEVVPLSIAVFSTHRITKTHFGNGHQPTDV